MKGDGFRMNIVFLGPPGAGKGTQGARLAEATGMHRIATGDLVRQEVRRDSALGREAATYSDAGELVPDELMLELLREEMGRTGEGASWIFDGYPRNLAQAGSLDELLAEVGKQVDHILLLEVPEDLLFKRLSGRRACGDCGEAYNIYFRKPEQPGRCDKCGGRLETRADDEPSAVRRRLQVYRDNTYPVVDYYRGNGRAVHVVDGAQPVGKVAQDLCDALSSR